MPTRVHGPIVLLLTAAFLAGAGCSTVRRAREAQRGEDTPPGERTLRAAEIGLTSNRVLGMEEAVSLALAYHPTIALASQNLAAAVSQFHEAYSAYGPSVNASAGYSKSSANTAEDTSGGKTKDSYSASLGLDLTLFDFGRTPAAIRAARERRLAAEESLRSTRNTVAYGVRSAFLGLGKAQELFLVAEGAVRQYREHLDQVKAFAEVGRLIRYDVTKAEVDLGNAELDLINTRSELSNARAALNRSLGLAEEPGYRIATNAWEELSGTVDGLMAKAREQHPDLALLRAQERAASAAVDRAIADLYPNLGMSAQYGGSGAELPLAWNWSVGLQGVLSLFTSWQDTEKVDEAVAGLRAARAKIADREQQIYLDLGRAWNQMESALQRLQLTDLIVRSAQQSLDLISERYILKAASAVEVTDAQVALTRAQGDRVKARFDHQAALAQIKYTVGEQ